MAAQIGYYDILKSVAGKVFTFLSTITLTGVDGKTLTVNDSCSVGGAAVNATLPAFLAYASASKDTVTGDGTAYTVLFDTEVFDQANNYDPATGIFTAPVTGRYQFSMSALLNHIAAENTYLEIDFVTSNRTYYFNDYLCLAKDRQLQLSVLADLDANDTAKVNVIVGGATKIVDEIGRAHV